MTPLPGWYDAVDHAVDHMAVDLARRNTVIHANANVSGFQAIDAYAETAIHARTDSRYLRLPHRGSRYPVHLFQPPLGEL